jgi:hypothetical protein
MLKQLIFLAYSDIILTPFTNVDWGKFITGMLMVSDGSLIISTWIATTFGSASIHPGLGWYFGIVHSPLIVAGLWEIEHGLVTINESVDSPSYNFETNDNTSPCP